MTRKINAWATLLLAIPCHSSAGWVARHSQNAPHLFFLETDVQGRDSHGRTVPIRVVFTSARGNPPYNISLSFHFEDATRSKSLDFSRFEGPECEALARKSLMLVYHGRRQAFFGNGVFGPQGDFQIEFSASNGAEDYDLIRRVAERPGLMSLRLEDPVRTAEYITATVDMKGVEVFLKKGFEGVPDLRARGKEAPVQHNNKSPSRPPAGPKGVH